MKYQEFFRDEFGGCALYSLRNSSGFGVDISDFGGTVVNLWVPDRRGELINVALHCEHPETYRSNPCYFGALVGRVPNRIGAGRFTLDGVRYQSVLNDRDHSTLHGGFSFARRLWRLESADDGCLALSLDSPDGDAGFPGHLTVRAEYRVLENNTLELEINAECDRPTVADFTNHTYFNLGGEGNDCSGTTITLASSRRTVVDEFLVPTGELADVTGTPYDLRRGRKFEDIIRDIPEGLDDNFILSDELVALKRSCIAAVSEHTGIRLEMDTTQSGVQLYMGGCLGDELSRYPRFGGFCLETQNWPDAVNHANFPSIRLDKGMSRRIFTAYRFSTEA